MSTATTETIPAPDTHSGAHGDEHAHDWDYIKIALILGRHHRRRGGDVLPRPVVDGAAPRRSSR